VKEAREADEELSDGPASLARETHWPFVQHVSKIAAMILNSKEEPGI
jgi:hypothetical protein